MHQWVSNHSSSWPKRQSYLTAVRKIFSGWPSSSGYYGQGNNYDYGPSLGHMLSPGPDHSLG